MTQGSHQLTEEEQREIQRIREDLGTEFCQRCDYCQPCVEEIPISTVMNCSVLGRDLPPEELFSGEIAEAMEKAAFCTECGACEERCPFLLSIRETMAEQVRWYQEEKRIFQEHLNETRSKKGE